MRNKYDNILSHWQRYVDLFSDAFNQAQKISPEDVLQKAYALSDETRMDPTNDVIRSGLGQSDSSLSPTVLCSPHPDDECLTGALPLRLLHENKAQVVNLAVTLGSDIDRRAQRKNELEDACRLLGFQNKIVGGEFGLENVNLNFRESSPELWRTLVETVVEQFIKMTPALVILPHEKDGHITHKGTNVLVSEALAIYTHNSKSDVLIVENEFWHPIMNPNLMIGVDKNDVALLIAAMTQHKGEISRNPYHLWMPARLMDNVRRGWELVRGCQEKTPDFCFAELYRVSVYSQGEKKKWGKPNTVISPRQDINLER